MPPRPVPAFSPTVDDSPIQELADASRRPPIPSSSGPIRRMSTSTKKVIIPYVIDGKNIVPSSSTTAATSGNISNTTDKPSPSSTIPSSITNPSNTTASPTPNPNPSPSPLLKSCLECSRLKIRCSRTIPCTSCVRRGVEQICPNGKMASGKGRRLIMADSRDLHERIGMLERALARSHEEKIRAERGLRRGSAGSVSVDASSSTGATPSSDSAQLPPGTPTEDRTIFEPHPALLDSYLYSPKDPPNRHFTPDAATGISSGRADTPIRDVRDVLMDDPDHDGGSVEGPDVGDEGFDGPEVMDVDVEANKRGRLTGPTRTSTRRTSNGRGGAGPGLGQNGRRPGASTGVGKKVKTEPNVGTETGPIDVGGASPGSGPSLNPNPNPMSRRKPAGITKARGGKKTQTQARRESDDVDVDAGGQIGTDDVPSGTKRIHQLAQTTTNSSGRIEDDNTAVAGVNANNDNDANVDHAKVGGRSQQQQQHHQQQQQAEISLGTLTIGAQGEAVYIGAAGGSSFLHESGPSPPLTSPRTYGFRIPHPQRSLNARLGQTTATSTTNASFSAHQGSPPRVGAYPGHPDGGGSGLPLAEDPYTSLLGDFPLAGSSSLTLHELWHMIPAWEEDLGGESVMENGNLMVQAYWENCDWMYNTLPRPIFDADYLPAVYDSQTVPSPHKLACVYLVMALGVMFDLERREPFDPQGGELFRLGVACLTVNGALSRPTVATVQALNLMGNFMLNDKSPHGAQAFWPFLGVAANCVTALGLHRDGTTFGGLSPYEIEERRKVFWEMTTLDRLQAMCFARPCALSNRSIDSKFPGEDVSDESMRLPDPDGYNDAKYRLVHIMDHVIEEQTRTTKGTYQDVLAIDKMIVDFRRILPEMMLPDKKASALTLEPDIHPHVMMHRFSIRLLVCECKIYLHRLYFNKALSEITQSPLDPSAPGSNFGSSFVAVFESAVELISIVRQCVVYHPALTSRWWFFWFHAFSAAVCLAAVCIKAPSSAFASPAYISLVMSCDIAGAAAEGTKAKGGLPVLLRLRQRASYAMLSIGQQRLPTATSRNQPTTDGGSSRPLDGSVPTSRLADAGAGPDPVSTGRTTAGTSPERTTSSPDDDLSHLSNRPQLRRVNPSLTSPVVSTPTLMTDEGIGSSTSNTRSAGSGSGSITGSGGSGPRSLGQSRANPIRSGQTSPVSPGDGRTFLESQGALPFRIHGLNGADTFGPPFEAMPRQTDGARQSGPYAPPAGAPAGGGGFLELRSAGEPGHGGSTGYVPAMGDGPGDPMAWAGDGSGEAMGSTLWSHPTAGAFPSGDLPPHNAMNWMFAGPAIDPAQTQDTHQALEQPVLSLHDIDAYGMLLASDSILDTGSVTATGRGAGDTFGFIGTIGNGAPVHHIQERENGGGMWYPAVAVNPSSMGTVHADGFVHTLGSLITTGEIGASERDDGNAHWGPAQFDRNGLDGQRSVGPQGYALTGEGPLPSHLWHGEMTLPMMDSPGTREDLDRFMAQMYENRAE